jgi:hypothetical protein
VAGKWGFSQEFLQQGLLNLGRYQRIFSKTYVTRKLYRNLKVFLSNGDGPQLIGAIMPSSHIINFMKNNLAKYQTKIIYNKFPNFQKKYYLRYPRTARTVRISAIIGDLPQPQAVARRFYVSL